MMASLSQEKIKLSLITSDENEIASGIKDHVSEKDCHLRKR
jgi:hypothetical protein